MNQLKPCSCGSVVFEKTTPVRGYIVDILTITTSGVKTKRAADKIRVEREPKSVTCLSLRKAHPRIKIKVAPPLENKSFMKPKSTVDSPTSRQVTLENVKKMSDEELRLAIAKVCPDLFEFHETYASELPDGKFRKFLVRKGEGVTGDEIDPVHDLNAVHEVEQSLSEDQKWQYGLLLANVVRTPENVAFCDPPNKAFPLNELGLFELANLTARQRCEALVLCLSPDSKNTNA